MGGRGFADRPATFVLRWERGGEYFVRGPSSEKLISDISIPPRGEGKAADDESAESSGGGSGVACEGGDGDGTGPPDLSEDEKYLIDAYVDVKQARSNYPHHPAVAESLFTVLDSTIDSVRIANTIRDVCSSSKSLIISVQ